MTKGYRFVEVLGFNSCVKFRKGVVVNREGSKRPKGKRKKGKDLQGEAVCRQKGAPHRDGTAVENLSSTKGISTPGGGAQPDSDVFSWHLNTELTHQMA